MTRALLLALAALCGAIIAVAFTPRRVAASGELPSVADNEFELRSLIMANESARDALRSQAETIRLWKARAQGKAVHLPAPKEREN